MMYTVVKMQIYFLLSDSLNESICSNQDYAKFRIDKLVPLYFMSLNWIGHIPQKDELEFKLEWQKAECTEL